MFSYCCGAQPQGAVVEHVAQRGNHAAPAGGKEGEGVAEAAKKAVQETVVEKVAEAKEQTSGTTGAAAVGSVAMAFEVGKEEKTVVFKSRIVGFECGLGGGSCCGSHSRPKVVVRKVVAGQQAEQLGVKEGWVVKSVNGKEVTGLQQAAQLWAEAAAKLPDVA